ncbi:MAG: MATE family efflux transporter [Lachnospiraceae bacterium]|nr:MATE family efflux transporter [Lachnospiraceae bacterium]MEE3461202.1 MATE family efflux transporter [Lachnospiraceae bacterium]
MKQKTVFQLFVPIYFEVLLYMLSGMVDTLMLSTLNDQAVGAVGTVNTYYNLFITMFSIISTGMISVETQNIGAGRSYAAVRAKNISAKVNLIFGAIVSLALFFFAKDILTAVGIADELLSYGITYMKTVGLFCFLNALIPVYASTLRSFGHSKEPMIATVIANIINIVLNSVFLFALHMGVLGVALATVISRIANIMCVIIMEKRLINEKELKAEDPCDDVTDRKILGQIIHIGLPSAFENILYNIAIVIITRLLNGMDSAGFNITVRSYAITISNFSASVGIALCQANAIVVGWKMGSLDFDACDRTTRRSAFLGAVIAVGIALLLAGTSPLYMKIFTDNPDMASWVTKCLFVDIVLEIGKACNVVYGSALKTAGDVIFPMVIAVIFMFLLASGGTYVLGLKIGLGAFGSHIGLAMDECTRAVFMGFRWKKGVWKHTGLFSRENA